MSHPDVSPRYIKLQAKHLLKDLRSNHEERIQGARYRLARRFEWASSMPLETLREEVGYETCLHVVAAEHGYRSWQDVGAKGGTPLPNEANIPDTLQIEVPDDGRLKVFTLDFGNSSQGPCGAVMEIRAYTADEAIENAHEALPECSGEIHRHAHFEDVEYLACFFNIERRAFVRGHITEWEYADDEGDGDTDSQDTPSGGSSPSNVIFHYKYADGDNYRRGGEVVFEADIQDQETLEALEARLQSVMDEGMFFIAHQVGIPEVFIYLADDKKVTDSDHSWHTFRDLESTDRPPTDPRPFKQFVEEVERASEAGWDEFDPAVRSD